MCSWTGRITLVQLFLQPLCHGGILLFLRHGSRVLNCSSLAIVTTSRIIDHHDIVVVIVIIVVVTYVNDAACVLVANIGATSR